MQRAIGNVGAFVALTGWGNWIVASCGAARVNAVLALLLGFCATTAVSFLVVRVLARGGVCTGTGCGPQGNPLYTLGAGFCAAYLATFAGGTVLLAMTVALVVNVISEEVCCAF